MARVLTLEEARNALWKNDVIWVEYHDTKYRDAVVAAIMIAALGYWMDQNDDIIEPSALDDDKGDGPYNREFRIWDSKPDYLQRKAVEWK